MRVFAEKQFRFDIKPMFFHSAFCDKSFFAKANRKLLLSETESRYPPALETRIRDNVETFDTEIVMNSFKKLLKSKIPLKLKSFHVEFLYRTLASRNELFNP